MPRTSSDKLKLGLDEIADLSPSYVCKGFHGDYLKCNGIIKLQDKLAESKVFSAEGQCLE